MSTDNQNTPSATSSSSDASADAATPRPIHLAWDIPRGGSQFYSSGEEHQPGAYGTTDRSPKGKRIPSRTVQPPAALNSINDSVSLDLDASTEIQYRGNERVIQVLRWLSSAILAVNNHYTDTLISAIDPQDPDKKRNEIKYNGMKSPEIQAAVVGEQVLAGSNSNDDGHMINNLLVFLQERNSDKIDTHLGAAPASPAAAASAHDTERARQIAQQRRHAGYLWDFVNNTDNFAGRLIAHARREAEAGVPGDGALAERLLTSILTALQSGNNLEMAGCDASRALVHAEQRIIEHVQRIQDILHPQSLQYYPPAYAQRPLPVFLAGTKPPCAHCDTVEHARHQQAQLQQSQSSSAAAHQESLFTIWRCEDPTTLPGQHSIGKFFGSTFLLPDTEVAYNIDYTILTRNGASLPVDFGHHIHGTGQPSLDYVAQPNTQHYVRLNSRQHGESPLTPSPEPQPAGQNPLKPAAPAGSLDAPVTGQWQPIDVQQLTAEIQEQSIILTPNEEAESRWVIQLQGDDTTSDAALRLFLKHPGSELIQWNTEAAESDRNSSLRWDSQGNILIQGPVSASKNKLKILFIGHGLEGAFGGRTFAQWKIEFDRLLAGIPQGVEQVHITLVGCRLADSRAYAGSLPQELADSLLQWANNRKIAPANLTLSAHKNYVHVRQDGSKETYINRQWVSTASELAQSEGYKLVWSYDSTSGKMVPDINTQGSQAFSDVTGSIAPQSSSVSAVSADSHRPRSSSSPPKFPTHCDTDSIGTEIELSGVIVAMTENSEQPFGYITDSSGNPLFKLTKDMLKSPYRNPAEVKIDGKPIERKGTWYCYTLELVSYPCAMEDEQAIKLRSDATLWLVNALKNNINRNNHSKLQDQTSSQFNLIITNHEHFIAGNDGSEKRCDQASISMASGRQATIAVSAKELFNSASGTVRSETIRLLESAPWYNAGFKESFQSKTQGNSLDDPTGAKNVFACLASMHTRTTELALQYGLIINDWAPQRLVIQPKSLAHSEVKNAWTILPRTRPFVMLALLSPNDRTIVCEQLRNITGHHTTEILAKQQQIINDNPQHGPVDSNHLTALKDNIYKYFVFNEGSVAGHDVDNATTGAGDDKGQAILFEFRTLPDELDKYFPSQIQNTTRLKMHLLDSFDLKGRRLIIEAVNRLTDENITEFTDWLNKKRESAGQPPSKNPEGADINKKIEWLQQDNFEAWQKIISDVSHTLEDIPGVERWKWRNEAHQQTLAEEIKKKLTTVDPIQDTAESQWIIQLQGDSATSDTTGNLLLKNPAGSELILWDPQADTSDMDSGLKWDASIQKLVYSALLPPKDRLSIFLIGHDADSSTDAAFGGRSLDAWKSDFSRMLARIPQGSVSRIDVILTGYQRVDEMSSEGELPRQLADLLLERGRSLGMTPESLSFSTQQYCTQSLPDGKNEIYVPGEGWVSADTAAEGRHNVVWHYDNSTQKMLPEVSAGTSSAPDVKKSVPDILHFIWLGKLDAVQQDYINTWAVVNRDKKIKVWYDPDALLSYELGKRIKGYVLAQAEHLIHTPGYINAVLQLQNEAHAFISNALSQGSTFDRAAADFMQEKLGVPQADLVRIRQENGDSYQHFIKQCDANQISLADVKTLKGGFNRHYYYRELSLRQNLPAASDMIRLDALDQDGGIYFDADLLPRFQEAVFADIQHPDFPARNKPVLLQFAQTQLVMEYLHSQGYFNGRQIKVDAGQYSDHVTRYIQGNTSGNTHGVEARTALIQTLRDAIQRAGQTHLDSGSTASLMSVFFSSLTNISIHPDLMKVGSIMGGYSNAALASHPGSKTLDYAFKKINDNYAILEKNDLINVNSTQELEQRVSTAITIAQELQQQQRANTATAARNDDILNNVQILSYRLDNLTDARATIDITGPNLIGKVVTQVFAEMAHSRKNEGQFSDEAEEARSEVLFYDFNNATEEEAKSSWANNSSGRPWPFERLTLPENISTHLNELNGTDKKSFSAADKALLIVAESFDTFQKAQGEKKITALVKLRKDLINAQEKCEEKGEFYLSDTLKKTLRQIENGRFLDIPVKDMETFIGSVKKQPESEQKQALLAVIDVFSTFLSVSQEKGVAALLMMRKQLVSTLALLPVLGNGKTTENALRETVVRMQEKIDRELFSKGSQNETDRTEMPAAIREKIIDISGWSLEKAAWVHYHADAALQGALGYNEQRASDLADREIASRQVFLSELKDQISKFNIQVDRLYNGQIFFHELSIEEQQLISRFLDAGETAELIRRSEDGRILHQAAAILAEKSVDAVASVTDLRAALHAVIDEESAAWQHLAQNVGLAADTRADNEAGRVVLESMRQQGGDVDNTRIPSDSYTTKAIGLRTRVLHKLQTFLDRSGKVVLAIGSVAALSRIQVINYRLTHEKNLSDAKKAELNTEKALAITELGADLSDEIVELIQSKFSISITRPPAGQINVSTPLFRQSSLSVGTRIVQGIRTFGLEALGTILSAVGTGFAWYGVHKAISELDELRKSQQDTRDPELKAELTEKITQLQVNLNVNIATAVVSTILTTGSIVSLTAGIAAGFGLAGATLVLAVAKAFLAVAGPVGGAIMVAAFIGLWIYNGIKTVEEFSKYLDLSSDEKFELGFTSIFGAPPASLQVKYDLSKMQAALKKTMVQEALGVFDSYHSVKTTHNYLIPHIQYDRNPATQIDESTRRLYAAYNIDFLLMPTPLIQTGTSYASVNIDMDAKKYHRTLNGETKSFDEKEHIYVRKTRDQVKSTAIKQPLDIITLQDLKAHPQKALIIFDSYSNESGFEINSAPFIALLSLDGKPDYQHLVIHSEDNENRTNKRTQLIKLQDKKSTKIQAACSVRLDDDNIDDMLLVLSDRVLALSGGKQDFSLPEKFSEDTAGLLAILHTDPAARIHAVRENEQITFFCIYQEEGQNKLTFFKFRKNENGRYQLDARLPEAVSIDMWTHKITVSENDTFGGADNSNSIFFQDLDGDSLADMVVIDKQGNLKVACQKRDGTFVPTENFSFFRVKAADGSLENLSFSGHKILGFCGTARTLYSRDNSENLYAHTIVSRAENTAEVSWVNLNIPGNGRSRFIASVKPDAGDFIFLLGGGGIKHVDGGVNSDIFYLLDIKTDAVVDGGKGRDTLDFSRLSKTAVSSVAINVTDEAILQAIGVEKEWMSDKGIAAVRGTDGSLQVIVFSNIENFTGTHGNDELTGDGNDNTLDGVGGKDTVNAGAGNDVLKGVEGTFSGDLGIDYYQLRAIEQTTDRQRLNVIATREIDIIEDYSLGEDSYVMLDYRLDQINSVTVEKGKHLLITFFTGEVQYRFNDFYANTYAGANKKTSSFEFTTKDGFRFRLKTAATPPDGITELSGIPVLFEGTLTEEEREKAIINLYAGDEDTTARVDIIETIAGQLVWHKIVLPALFELQLQHNGKRGIILGSGRPEILTGSGSIIMEGYEGADTYLIKDAKKGIVTINNEDISSVPEQDSLILPWALPETMLSVEGSDVLLSHKNTDSHVIIRLCDFMTKEESRHLVVRDISGLEYRPRITQESVAYLASGPLILDKEDRLEVLSASPGRLTLDGRKRDLSSAEKNKFTVIIDHSARGNDLYGAEDVRNYLQVSGGDNHLYGGTLADVLQGGTGNDRMEGKEGDDIYYVQGSATIEDTGGEDILVLTQARNELLTLEKMADNSLEIAYGRALDRKKVIVKNFFTPAAQNKRIEHIVAEDALYIINYARLIEGDMSYMASVISTMPTLTERRVAHNSPVLADTVSRQNNLLTASAA